MSTAPHHHHGTGEPTRAAPAAHDKHAGHSVVMFRDRFVIALLLTVPTVVWGHMLPGALGYDPPAIPGARWIPAFSGGVVYLYGGRPFLSGAIAEIRHRLPGMMTLIALAITVAFAFSVAVTLGFPGMPLWEELATPGDHHAPRSVDRDAIDRPGQGNFSGLADTSDSLVLPPAAARPVARRGRAGLMVREAEPGYVGGVTLPGPARRQCSRPSYLDQHGPHGPRPQIGPTRYSPDRHQLVPAPFMSVVRPDWNRRSRTFSQPRGGFMRYLWFFLGAIVAGACAKAPDPPPPPPPFSLADVAGTWRMRALPASGDTTLVEYEINGTADPSTWMITLPDRAPMPLRVSVAGDSMTAEAGPYESVLRKGVVVMTKVVSRLQDGKMVGTFTAKYATRMVDSVLTGRVEGTRVP